MLCACKECDLVYKPDLHNTPHTLECPRCDSLPAKQIDPDELTQEQKEATQAYIFELTEHETVEDAMSTLGRAAMQVANEAPDRALLQMFEANMQSAMAAVACALYARLMGEDPWMLAFEGSERQHVMESLAEDFARRGYDVEFSWTDDVPFATGKAVPKAEVVQRELEEFRKGQPLPMPGALAELISNGNPKMLQLIAERPDAVPPEGRSTVAKTLHELLEGRDKILLAMSSDTYSSLAEILEEFQVPHYRNVEEIAGERIRYILPEKDGEYLERIRERLEHFQREGR